MEPAHLGMDRSRRGMGAIRNGINEGQGGMNGDRAGWMVIVAGRRVARAGFCGSSVLRLHFEPLGRGRRRMA